MGVGVVLTVIGIVALLSAMLAVVFLLADAGGSVTAPCADFGCAFGARPENIPSEAAIAIAALMTVWASVWGVGRCFRWGLTKGGFYAHFDSKEDLARAVIDHATTTWMDKVASHVARFADPREQLRELLEAYRLYAVDRTFEGGCFFVNLSTEVDDQHEDLRKLVDIASSSSA